MKTRNLHFRPDVCQVVVLLFTVTLFVASAQAGTIKTIASTVPGNGDINPYGLAVVPTTTGSLTQGNILVSNFNNSANLQGTGTTIVQISPSGTVSLFAQIDANTLPGPCPGGIGLTTALVALKTGWVVVGSLPTTDGTSATAQAGCLLVLDSNGNVVETFYGSLINGPWDMTAADGGTNVAVFVTNVLNGTLAGGGKVVNHGTVLRLNLTIGKGSMPSLQSMTIIGSGFSERTDPAAVVIGPTGVGLGRNDNDDEEDESGESGMVSRRRKKPWRYRWPDDFRDEVLARLLELNRQRAEQERLNGAVAQAKPRKPKKPARKSSGPRQMGMF